MKKIIKFLKLICSPAKDGMHHEDYLDANPLYDLPKSKYTKKDIDELLKIIRDLNRLEKRERAAKEKYRQRLISRVE